MTIDLTTPSAATDTFAPTGPPPPCAACATGGVHLPGDPGYDAARLPWNVAVDQRPAAVAYPATAAEVGRWSAPPPRPVCGSPRRAPATTPARSPRRASTTSSLVRTSRA